MRGVSGVVGARTRSIRSIRVGLLASNHPLVSRPCATEFNRGKRLSHVRSINGRTWDKRSIWRHVRWSRLV